MVSVIGESNSIVKNVAARGMVGRKAVRLKLHLRMRSIELCIRLLVAVAGSDVHCYRFRAFLTQPLGARFLSRRGIVVKVAANFYEVVCEFPNLQ